MRTMNHIALAGVKHTGKSTKGRLLAEAHQGVFHDLDDLITAILPQGYTVRSWYREKGQQAFMDMETRALEEYFNRKEEGFRCLALGGATLENPRAKEILLSAPICLCGLTDREDVLFQRILNKGLPPFLETDDPRETFHQLYEKRSRTIRQYCHILVNMDGMSLEEAVADIDRKLKAYKETLTLKGE